MTNGIPSYNAPSIRFLPVILLLAFCGSATLATSQTAIGSGLNATEGAGISGNTSAPYTDTLWADTNNQRWLMSNHTGTGIPVAAWPCVSAGCIPLRARLKSAVTSRRRIWTFQGRD